MTFAQQNVYDHQSRIKYNHVVAFQMQRKSRVSFVSSSLCCIGNVLHMGGEPTGRRDPENPGRMMGGSLGLYDFDRCAVSGRVTQERELVGPEQHNGQKNWDFLVLSVMKD